MLTNETAKLAYEAVVALTPSTLIFLESMEDEPKKLDNISKIFTLNGCRELTHALLRMIERSEYLNSQKNKDAIIEKILNRLVLGDPEKIVIDLRTDLELMIGKGEYCSILPYLILKGEEAWPVYSTYTDIAIDLVMTGADAKSVAVFRDILLYNRTFCERKKDQIRHSMLLCTCIPSSQFFNVVAEAINDLGLGDFQPSTAEELLGYIDSLGEEAMEYIISLMHTGMTLKYLESAGLVTDFWSHQSPRLATTFSMFDRNIKACMKIDSDAPFSVASWSRSRMDFISAFISSTCNSSTARILFKQFLNAHDWITAHFVYLSFAMEMGDNAFDSVILRYLTRCKESGDSLVIVLGPVQLKFAVSFLLNDSEAYQLLNEMMASDLRAMLAENPNETIRKRIRKHCKVPSYFFMHKFLPAVQKQYFTETEWKRIKMVLLLPVQDS